MKVSNEVLVILGQCEVKGQTIKLPDIQLDRKVYTAVNKVLCEMGGKWNKKAKAHCFYDDVNVQGIYSQTIETGEVVAVFKQIQFFETPAIVVNEMIRHAQIHKSHRVLEPSAGKGAIAKALLKIGCKVDTCEIHQPFADLLFKEGFLSMWEGDFLDYNLFTNYDRIVANPPFTNQQDIKHVSHMIDCLIGGGRLVTVMSTGFGFRTDKRTEALKSKLDDLCDWHTIDLPEKSFKKSGTNVSTILLIAEKL